MYQTFNMEVFQGKGSQIAHLTSYNQGFPLEQSN